MSDYTSGDLRSAARFAAEGAYWPASASAAEVDDRPEVVCTCEANGVDPDLDEDGVCLHCEAMEAEDREHQDELRRLPW